ncbi:MAG TPA: DUF4386 domain-containing protein [Actinomycetota bacterium]|nr:DUF4386 domain-containing protein [Actinomycetota bacterium]
MSATAATVQKPSSPIRPAMDSTRSVRDAGVVAGAALLLMALVAGFGHFVAIEGLVTQGDAARTATDVMASEGLFRLGIGSLFLVVVLDVVIALALYRVFSFVSPTASMLAAGFRLVYAAVFMVAIGELAGALRLLGDQGYLTVFRSDQLQAQALLRIEAFTDIWNAGFVLFGIHLMAIGYLAYRSGFVPKLLGAVIGIAGFGYLFDSFSAALSQGEPLEISGISFVGEFLLALWLVIWGRRIVLNEQVHPEDVVNARNDAIDPVPARV